jgi:type I restriction enzyme S subunit
MGWELIKLGELGSISSGSTPSRKNDKYYFGTIPWVRTGEVKGKVISNTEELISEDALKNTSCRLYPVGSLIIAMYGQGKTRGQVGLLGIEAATNQACAVIPPTEKMNYIFLLSLLKIAYNDLRELGRGGNQPNLNGSLIKNYKVIFPSIVLQTQFEERVQEIEQQKEQAEQSLQKSEDLFQSLLQRAFRGEL